LPRVAIVKEPLELLAQRNGIRKIGEEYMGGFFGGYQVKILAANS